MKRIKLIVAACAGAIALACIACAGWVYAFGPAPLGKDIELSHVVLDREGRLLRAYATKDGRWRLPASVEDVDPRFFKLLYAYEDKRFLTHHGVDLLAMTRAAWQLGSTGHIISGGSTLTMQVARLLEPREHRTVTAKLRQVTRALQLEYGLSKPEILSLYLTLAPYGGNLEGIRAASLAYFGKEPRRLTLGEAALLVALPQSPETRRPDRHSGRAQAARDRVLDRVALAGAVPHDEIARAKAEIVPHVRRPMPVFAPHSADRIVISEPDRRIHRLTIDQPLQAKLQTLAKERAEALGPDISVAILAVDNDSGEVRARVASSDYFDTRRAGQVDMTAALRSPGSTLKPFIYGLGFEDGLIHPETLIDDRPQRYGGYMPENFDLTFQGTVTVRRALQLSLNVPAIAVLDKVGVNRLSARLTQAGAALVLPKEEAPGLAMGLGGVGVTLNDLTMLYAGLARGGEAEPLVERLGQANPPSRRLLDPVAAWYVGNVLIGAPPPENAPHNRLAFKTGTSYGYRDAWAVGFDGRMTVGVWVGRPDGAPVPGLVGRSAAAPILFDAFARSGATPAPLPAAPKGAVFAVSAKLPPPLQRFNAQAYGAAAEAPRIMFPPNGARLELASGGALDPMALKIAGGTGPLTVMVNGVPVGAPGHRRTLFVRPDGPGFVRLTVMDARGAADSVVIRIQ
ncbi:penicillin-binding protein 1C [Undibacter mobilis]|uniref:peptidoglycan glycosyltransferase n=1 Tax=Undibacter mobilis TaxID=2292256 RepID=A0A371B0P1_9BRAD|nr:penicillin-binding protein 1C [Undibacter mobilis]RDV01043.1 penicillin-binding protein 1C [Undibacter mobilis]